MGAQQHVYDNHKQFRIRWLELIQPPHTYVMAYEDTVDMPTVIASVSVKRGGKGHLMLKPTEHDRLKTLLAAAIKGVNPYSLDKSLFSPTSTKKARVEESEEEAEADTDTDIDEEMLMIAKAESSRPQTGQTPARQSKRA